MQCNTFSTNHHTPTHGFIHAEDEKILDSAESPYNGQWNAWNSDSLVPGLSEGHDHHFSSFLVVPEDDRSNVRCAAEQRKGVSVSAQKIDRLIAQKE